MKPYYQDDNCTIYNGDCREILPSLDAVADLLISDPPYGVGYKGRSSQDRSIPNDTKLFPIDACILAAVRKLRRGRHLYVFEYDCPETMPICGKTYLIWDKGIIGMGGPHCWSKSFERIFFGVYEISSANRAKGYGNRTARLRRESVIAVQRFHSAGIKDHPTEKPVELLRQLIESSSLFGEIVLDPFMGSGSTLVAAVMEGRKAIGIELEEKYCEIAANRLMGIDHENRITNKEG